MKTMARTVSWTVQEEDLHNDRFTGTDRGRSGGSANKVRVVTIEQFLRNKGCSHHVLTHLKRTDHGILKNGGWAYANQPVTAGDVITVRVEETETSEQITPVPLLLSVVYEDEDVLVVDKPCDMPVHPSMGNHENTLANAVMYYYAAKDQRFVFRCITRLDRDTTGLVLIAKNELSGAILSQKSALRQIHREYLAVTEGILPGRGTIDAPIARQQGSPLMRCVDFEHGERAVTHYQRLGVYRKTAKKAVPEAIGAAEDMHTCSSGEAVSLAAVRLETGRTHQIRVHMNFIGHSLPGDFLYNPDSVCDLAPRQMLHAYRLTFAHPISGETLSFESEMPPDMRLLLRQYRE